MDSIVRGKYALPPRLQSVKVISGFRIHLAFANGVEREIDLEPHLNGPVFEPIRNDPKFFAAVQVDELGDTICWPNGADIAPETLYYDGKPPWVANKARNVSSSPRRSGNRKMKKVTTTRRKE